MAPVELVLVLVLGGAGLALAARSIARGGVVLASATLVALAVVAVAMAAGRKPPHDAGAPGRTKPSAALGSGACRSCHPGEHASWHASFHRTMTRLGGDPSIRAPFDGRALEADGRSVTLYEKQGIRYARLPDPDLVAHATLAGSTAPAASAPLVTREIVLATGSHHHEVFWVRGERGNELRLVPITYLVAERRFVPRRDAFLQPPDARPHAVRWNSNCIQCHATLGRPEHDQTTDRFSSTAAELGIACEACHGPGATHAERHRNPLTRLASRLDRGADPTIVNPARLSPERASEVCGQCHSYFVPKDEDAFWTSGFAERYRPGDVLSNSRTLLRRETTNAPGSPAVLEAETESLFWGDGTIRVGGRELNGLEASACFLRGTGKNKLSCLSCHSMHASDPDDQLRRDSSVDAACERCHAHEADRRETHTHHEKGSPGSSCVGCHMPFTSYALFKGIRSHRIDSPSAEQSAKTGRPNACNLCHLDRSLRWTAEHLGSWYGNAETVPPGDVSASLSDLVAGDAAKRAVVAWAFGRPEAQRASRNDWQAAYLAELLDDPYAAVRKVAAASLSTLPGFVGFDADFTAEPETRRAARTRALLRWQQGFRPRTAPELLLAGPLGRDEAGLAALVRTRDDRPTTISE